MDSKLIIRIMESLEFFMYLFIDWNYFFSGCIHSDNSVPLIPPKPQPELHANYEYKNDRSVSLGCYERVSGYVNNTRKSPANNAVLQFSLVNTKTGTIRD